MFAVAVRLNRICDTHYLVNQARHSRRTDKTSRVRPDAFPGTAIHQVSAGSDPRDYLTNYRALQSKSGASARKGSAIACQLLVCVSPEWVEETGGLHDLNNPRNPALLNASIAWVESWAGDGSVFGARLDLDESGGATVDLFVAPFRELKHKSGARRLTISVRQALRELQFKYHEAKSFCALQTGWAAWAGAYLDPRLQRGIRIEQTKRPHLDVDAFKAEKAELHRREQEIAQRQKAVEEAEQLLKRRAKKLDEWHRSQQSTLQEKNQVLIATVTALKHPGFRDIRPPTITGDKWRINATLDDEKLREALKQSRPLWPVMHDLMAAAEEATARGSYPPGGAARQKQVSRRAHSP